MCSWCYGFRPIFRELVEQLPSDIEVKYVMGGLAPESDEPMPKETREYVQSQWRLVEEKTGVSFNWNFWAECQPRRSTYPSCRAVIAAEQQGKYYIPRMIDAIQNAYYRQARNPSDTKTLVELAFEIGLDRTKFQNTLLSTETEQKLHKSFQLRKKLHAHSFPSLRLQTSKSIHTIEINYQSAHAILVNITRFI